MSRGFPGGITARGAGFLRPDVVFSVVDPSERGYRACFLRSTGSCNVSLTVGSLDGGEATINFTVTARGAWLNASAWSNAKAMITGCNAADHQLAWQFCTERPPQTPERLTLIRAETGAAGSIPTGAVSVTLDLPDPAWAWSTDPTGGGAITFTQAIPADTRVDVLGGSYTPSIANRAVWWIDPL